MRYGMSDLANPMYSAQAVFDTGDGTLDFESLYVTHRPKMIHTLIRLGVDAVEAEDITQDVFLHTIDRQGTMRQSAISSHGLLLLQRTLQSRCTIAGNVRYWPGLPIGSTAKIRLLIQRRTFWLLFKKDSEKKRCCGRSPNLPTGSSNVS